MTTASEVHQINTTGVPRRQLRLVQLIVAGVATIAMLALFDAARPDTTETMIGSGSMRLTDMAFDVPAPASAPVDLQYPQAPPNLSIGQGFAADDDDDQAQQQELQDMQQTQQSEQQAEQENEAAQQQAQMDEQQANQ